MKTSERARIPKIVPAVLAVLILMAAAAAGNAAAHTGQAAPMDPAASLVLPETTGYTVSQPDGRSFDSPGQARTPTDESALPGSSYTNTAPAHEEPQGICGRNQAVQDSVLAELPNVSQCSGVTGEHLRGLSGTLDISGQGITALSAADFQGMSGITGMDASGNQLSSVPGDLLQQLRHQSHTHSTTETSRNGYVMAVIDKSGPMKNQLNAAKSGARWLAANRPTGIPMAVVAFSITAHTAQDFTTETDSLNNAINSLSRGGSTNIDGALAEAYRQAASRPDTSLPVAIIVFSDGGFTLSGSLHDTMSTNAANGVKVSAISTSGQNVKMQDLANRGGGVYNTQTSSSQSGSYFPAGTTSETTTTTTDHEPSIASLDLSGNSLASLPSGTFAQLPTLTGVNLRGNSLTSVPPGLPAGLTALDLSDNSIGSLPDGVFNGLAQLDALDLSDNSIGSLPDGVFNSLAQLDTLEMAGNPGAPFRFVIDLTQTGPATMAATLSQDAPFPMAASLTAQNAALSPNSVSIPRASKDGGIFTMTPDRNNAAEVTVGESRLMVCVENTGNTMLSTAVLGCDPVDWDALYESGYTFPAEVGFKIASVDALAAIRCSRMGLTRGECPQSTGDTVRRLMVAMMTQQAESHGPGPYGKGYAPEYAVAINHMFYRFIQFLEESPCQPMLYRYASAKTLKALQEGEFIPRCGKGWRINSEWKKEMDRTDPTNPGGRE